MTNRTVKLDGQGFGNVPVNVTITANGTPVYQGTIDTVDQPLPLPKYTLDPWPTMFGLQIPLNFVGSIPMSITVDSGFGILFSDSVANYNLVPNPIYTPEQYAVVTGPVKTAEGINIFESLASPPLSQEDIDILSNPASTDSECDAVLAQHGLSLLSPGGPDIFNDSFFNGDSRTNVALDGYPLSAPDPRPLGYQGDWTWVVPVGSTLTFDFNIESPGVE